MLATTTVLLLSQTLYAGNWRAWGVVELDSASRSTVGPQQEAAWQAHLIAGSVVRDGGEAAAQKPHNGGARTRGGLCGVVNWGWRGGSRGLEAAVGGGCGGLAKARHSCNCSGLLCWAQEVFCVGAEWLREEQKTREGAQDRDSESAPPPVWRRPPTAHSAAPP